MLTRPQGELEHRRSKGFFPRTSKKEYHLQMTKLERRATRLMRTTRTFDESQTDRHPHHPPFSDNDKTPTKPDGERYHMVDCSKHHQDLFSFDRGGDPAGKVLIVQTMHGASLIYLPIGLRAKLEESHTGPSAWQHIRRR